MVASDWVGTEHRGTKTGIDRDERTGSLKNRQKRQTWMVASDWVGTEQRGTETGIDRKTKRHAERQTFQQTDRKTDRDAGKWLGFLETVND